MGRRKKRSSAAKQETAQPSGDGCEAIDVRPPKTNKWFLAATILLQAGWLVFLGVLALTG